MELMVLIRKVAKFLMTFTLFTQITINKKHFNNYFLIPKVIGIVFLLLCIQKDFWRTIKVFKIFNLYFTKRYCNEQNFCGDHVFLGIKLDPYPYDVRFLYDPTLLHKKSSNNRCFVFKHQLNDLSSRKFYYQNDLLQIEKDKNTFGHYQEVSENDVIKMLLVDLMNHTINPNDNDLLGKTTFQDSIKQFSLTL